MACHRNRRVVGRGRRTRREIPAALPTCGINLKTELEPRMDTDRHGFPAGDSKRRIHPKDETSDNSFLISVHPCESVVLFSSRVNPQNRMPRQPLQEPTGQAANRRHEKTAGSSPQYWHDPPQGRAKIKLSLPAAAEDHNRRQAEGQQRPGLGLGDHLQINVARAGAAD